MYFYLKLSIIYLVLSIICCLSAAEQCTAAPLSQEVPEGLYRYEERNGDNIIPFNWQAEQSDNGIAITVHELGKTFYNLCRTDGQTIKWHVEIEGKHDITVVRNGDNLHFEGTRFGEKYSKTITIDERPWYQPLSYSLGHFLNSSKDKTSFWIIRADKIEVIALTAEKIGEEKIMFAGAKIPAQKVEVRADGFYSTFWYATYWYRKSDNLFLRYQSVHGLPGSEETIVELVETPAQSSAGS